MRLIDADALKKFMEHMLCTDKEPTKERYTCDVVCCVIDGAPTVDAVPVIRCKDCKHYKYRMCELIGNIMDGYYHGTFDVKRPDDFCSYGVKKSGGGENAAD